MKIANEESKFVTGNKMKSLHEKQRPPKNTASSANILYPTTNDNEIPPTPPTLSHRRHRRCYPTNGSDGIPPTTAIPLLPTMLSCQQHRRYPAAVDYAIPQSPTMLPRQRRRRYPAAANNAIHAIPLPPTMLSTLSRCRQRRCYPPATNCDDVPLQPR